MRPLFGGIIERELKDVTKPGDTFQIHALTGRWRVLIKIGPFAIPVLPWNEYLPVPCPHCTAAVEVRREVANDPLQ